MTPSEHVARVFLFFFFRDAVLHARAPTRTRMPTPYSCGERQPCRRRRYPDVPSCQTDGG